MQAKRGPYKPRRKPAQREPRSCLGCHKVFRPLMTGQHFCELCEVLRAEMGPRCDPRRIVFNNGGRFRDDEHWALGLI